MIRSGGEGGFVELAPGEPQTGAAVYLVGEGSTPAAQLDRGESALVVDGPATFNAPAAFNQSISFQNLTVEGLTRGDGYDPQSPVENR